MMVRSFQYDLVLVDIRLPDMTGFECFCAIKDARPELPVILMTGLVGDLARKVAHHRAVSFFEKGSGLDCFLQVVNETLNASPTART